MKMLRPYSIWTTIGVALFLGGGIFFGTGRFGAGVGLMVASAVCLGTAMTSHRRWIKRNGSD
jgi:drug/metabolite transporter (DMT)-like permease